MLQVLKHRIYARLFLAQVLALLGTGLLTIGLGLLAYDLAGNAAGSVLGTALAIKMVAYVGLAPVAAAVAERLPRKSVMVGADILRAGVALCLPFIDAVWQIYVLIFVLQAASATFTPAFQALIPDVLDKDEDYTRALSLSRIAYELENLLSPAIAGLLLIFISFNWLFAGTFLGFVASGVLVAGTTLPARNMDSGERSFLDRASRGIRIYIATPRLRGLWACGFAGAAAGAFVIVNTVVIVQGVYGGSESEVALAMAAFGAGAMCAALSLPSILDRIPDRPVMLWASAALSAMTLTHGLLWLVSGPLTWTAFLALWAVSGLCYSAIFTPAGRLLRRSAHSEDRPALFAAQFALSHAGWLLTYPIAGWIGRFAGLPVALILLGLLAFLGTFWAWRVWPQLASNDLVHSHPDLPPDHPHLKDHTGQNATHRHEFVIDDMHRVWPTEG